MHVKDTFGKFQAIFDHFAQIFEAKQSFFHLIQQAKMGFTA